MSATPRRSARLAAKAETPVRIATPVVAPAAPKKVRAPRKLSAKEVARMEYLRQRDIEDAIARDKHDARIRKLLDYLKPVMSANQVSKHGGAIQHLFQDLFTSDDFWNLGGIFLYQDQLFALLQTILADEKNGMIYHSNEQQFNNGWNRICLFLGECGDYDTIHMYRKYF